MQKRNKLVSMLIVIAMLITLIPANIVFAAGTGTINDPFLISNQAELEAISSAPDKCYKLKNNITINENFNTILNFSGMLDGAGYSISGLSSLAAFDGSIDQWKRTSVTGRLFETIDETGYVANLKLKSPKMSNEFKNLPDNGASGVRYMKMGLLCDYNNGTINNVTLNSATVDIEPHRIACRPSIILNDAGGMVYTNRGKIINCSISGKADTTEIQGNGFGGIACINEGTIANTTVNFDLDFKTQSYYSSVNFYYTSLGVGINTKTGTMYNVWVSGTMNNSLWEMSQYSYWNGYAVGDNEGLVDKCYYSCQTTGGKNFINVPYYGGSTGTTNLESKAYDNTIYNKNSQDNSQNIGELVNRNGSTVDDLTLATVTVILDGVTTTNYVAATGTYILPYSEDSTKYIIWKVGTDTTTYKSGSLVPFTTSITITGTSYTKGYIDETKQTYTYNKQKQVFVPKWISQPTVFATGDSIQAPDTSKFTLEYETAKRWGGEEDYTPEGVENYSYYGYNVIITSTYPENYYYRSYNQTFFEKVLKIDKLNIANLNPAPTFNIEESILPGKQNDASDTGTTATITETSNYGFPFNVSYSKYNGSSSTYNFKNTTEFGRNIIKIDGTTDNYTGSILLEGDDMAFYVTEVPKTLTVSATPTTSASYPNQITVSATFPGRTDLKGTMQFYYTPEGETTPVPLGAPVNCDGNVKTSGSDGRIDLTVNIGDQGTPALPFGTYSLSATYTPTFAEQTTSPYYSAASGKLDSYTVTKGTVTASNFTYTAPADLVFNGEAKVASVSTDSIGVTADSITYKKKNSDDTYTEISSAPKKAGTYGVWVNYSATTGYLSPTGSIKVGEFTIAPRTVNSFSITKEPAKKIFYIGEAFDISDMEVTVEYEGLTKVVSPADFADYDITMSTANGTVFTSDDEGNKTITVTQTESSKTVEFTIRVVQDTASLKIGDGSEVVYYSFAEALLALVDHYDALDETEQKAWTVDSATIKLLCDVDCGRNYLPGFPFTLDGNGKTIIATADEVSFNNDVFLKNLKIKGNSSYSDVILFAYWRKKITLENVSFEGNTYIDGAPELILNTDTTLYSVDVYSLKYNNNASLTVSTMNISRMELDDLTYINIPDLSVCNEFAKDYPSIQDHTDKADLCKKLLVRYNGNTYCLVKNTAQSAFECEYYDLTPHVMESIAVKDMPTKTDYIYGDTLDLSGITVDLIYNNGGVVNVKYADFAANGLSVTNNSDISTDSYPRGENSITIKHSPTNFECTFNIKVSPKIFTIDHGITTVTYTSQPISVHPTIKYGTTTYPLSGNFLINYFNLNEDGTVGNETSSVIAPGKYLYMITPAFSSHDEYDFKGYEDADLIPTGKNAEELKSKYEGYGILTISKSAPQSQKPIYFKDANISAFVTEETVTNTLTNPNDSTVTYESSNTDVATVANDGTVTIIGAGTATITATSEKSETSPVYASYVLNVKKSPVTITAKDKEVTFDSEWTDKEVTYSDGLTKDDFDGTLSFKTKYAKGSKVGNYDITPYGLTSEKYEITYESGTLTVNPKTLTTSDFTVTAAPKYYDGTDTAKISVTTTISNIKAVAEGSFADINAGQNKNVNYTISEITGKDAENYVLANGNLTGTVNADINKAKVSVICASATTRTFDGNVQSVDVSAMANGNVFDSSNYTVKYTKDSAFAEPKEVGVYTVSIALNDTTNYEVTPFTSILTIKAAAQDVFAIENVPERVYYGDTFKVTASGANGNVTYAISGNATIDTDGNVAVNGTGDVTITATSKKDGYTDKAATKKFTSYKRILTPSVTATDREYNGENDVETTVSLENIVNSDIITATSIGTMINADAGSGKIVYVSDITLSGDKKDLYVLATQNAQTSVDISKAKVTGFTISATDKTYDASNSAVAVVDTINGVINADKSQVTILGNAEFENETANENKTVTFTATSLTGSKSGNYEFANENSKIATSTATINPMKVEFVIGKVSFKYDGDEKSVDVSAVDETGKIFTDYTVEYLDENNNVVSPTEAGNYKVTITLDDTTNYSTDYTDKEMTISTVNQEQINVVGMPGTVAFRDEFTLEAIGGNGNGEFEWSSDNNNVTVTADSADTSKASVKVNGGVGEKVTLTIKKLSDGNYDEKETKVIFAPTKKNVSFILSELEQVFDENDKEITVTPDDTDATYSVLYNGKSTLPTESGTYTVTVNATDNYFGTATAMLTISKATLTGLSVSQENAEYGTVLADATYSSAPNGVNVSVKYSTVNGQKPINAGKYTVTATYTGKNYETFEASKEFEITKKELTVKAKDASRAYGEANPVFVLEYNGFVDGEDENILLSEPSATVNANSSSVTGEYAITVTGGRADNYAFNYDNSGKMNITGASGGSFYITGANNSVLVGDIFTLRAYYGNILPKVKWSSDNENIATVDQNGMVTINSCGNVTIKAEITDPNYAEGIIAEFNLNADKKTVVLIPTENVKVYDGMVQSILLTSDNADFVPVLTGANKNVDLTYTLTTDPTVTEAKNVGIYTVTYSISDSDPKFKGNGTATLYINKQNAVIKAANVEKNYGEANPEFNITGLLDSDMQNAEYVSKVKDMFTLSSEVDELNEKAEVGTYPITLKLKNGKSLNEDLNYNFTISDENGILTVNKAPLIINVEDVTRLFSEENSQPKYSYVGFANEDTEEVLTVKPIYTYIPTVTPKTVIGTYPDAVTLSGADAKNYEITYSYVNGEGADVTINKLPVTLSAGTSRSSYLTVNLDKAVLGLTKDNFNVSLDNANVEITEVSANTNGTQYTLKGTFTTGKEYSVLVSANDNYELKENTVIIIPRSGSNGSSGGSGGSSSGGIVSANYKITVEQGKNGEISPDTATVKKNDNKTFTITADEGYEITDVLVNGKSVGKVGEYTFKNVTKDEKITAVFEKIVAKEDDNKENTEPSTDDEWKNPFSDVKDSDWFNPYVKYVNKNGLMNGVEEKIFAPDMAVTRGMFITILYRMENEPETKLSTFEDVNANEYYAKAIGWANTNGIVSGVSETNFAPNENITREQMATVIFKYAKHKNKGPVGAWAIRLDYKDLADVSEYAGEAVMFAKLKNIMTGNENNEFNPQDSATRAETAAVIQRIIENL